MRVAKVLFKDEEAGMLTQFDDGSFSFRYNDNWMVSENKAAISLTMPKYLQEYRSEFPFPFFFNMLPEGSNKQVVCRTMKIDEDDYFGLLLTTAKYDTIGAVRILKTE